MALSPTGLTLHPSCLSFQGMGGDASGDVCPGHRAGSALSGLVLPQRKVWSEEGSRSPVLTRERTW